MTTATTNYAWGKPTIGADPDAWGAEINTILDSQDSYLALHGTRWAAAAGTVDAITAAYTPAIVALVNGMCLAARASGANTSTTPTFKPDTMSALTIKKCGGQALLAGDIPRASYECLLRYNSTGTYWELLNPKTVS